jgi:hypothetical protein
MNVCEMEPWNVMKIGLDYFPGLELGSSSMSLSQALGSTPDTPPLSATRAKHSWKIDGVNGGPSSNDIILDWICNPSNYERWQGARHGRGQNRESLCGEVVDKMKKNGIHWRTNRDIRTKIRELEFSFWEAHRWVQETGKQIQEVKGELGEKDIQSYLSKKCPYFERLAPILTQIHSELGDVGHDGGMEGEKENGQEKIQPQQSKLEQDKATHVNNRAFRRIIPYPAEPTTHVRNAFHFLFMHEPKLGFKHARTGGWESILLNGQIAISIYA